MGDLIQGPWGDEPPDSIFDSPHIEWCDKGNCEVVIQPDRNGNLANSVDMHNMTVHKGKK